MKDGGPFTFAGLWEGWKDPQTDEWLRTCTIITGEPNELVAQIHPRMPVILPEQHHAVWLGETENGNLKESACRSFSNFLSCFSTRLWAA
jgi:putative SOS response-associated peptidase YedK